MTWDTIDNIRAEMKGPMEEGELARIAYEAMKGQIALAHWDIVNKTGGHGMNYVLYPAEVKEFRDKLEEILNINNVHHPLNVYSGIAANGWQKAVLAQAIVPNLKEILELADSRSFIDDMRREYQTWDNIWQRTTFNHVTSGLDLSDSANRAGVSAYIGKPEDWIDKNRDKALGLVYQTYQRQS